MALKKKPVTGMRDILPAEMQVREYVMNQIRETGKVMNNDQVAALTALDFAYESVKAETEANRKIDELTARVAELEAALAARPEDGPAPHVATSSEAELLREIDALSEMCENAIFSDMQKGSIL